MQHYAPLSIECCVACCSLLVPTLVPFPPSHPHEINTPPINAADASVHVQPIELINSSNRRPISETSPSCIHRARTTAAVH